MTESDFKIVYTADGSLTCHNFDADELYHNSAGAFTEAWQNYCYPAALNAIPNAVTSIAILDVCFGLGYNAYVAIQQILEFAPHVTDILIVGLDRDPKILKLLPQVVAQDRFEKLRRFVPEITTVDKFGEYVFQFKDARVILKLVEGDLRKVVPHLVQDFDIVFHDGFSPSKMPELWTIDLFRCYKELLTKRSGKMFTYSSASGVRGALNQLGFKLYRTAALGKKRGGTAASLLPLSADDAISELTELEQKRLITVGSVPYRDPQFDATREMILQTRTREQEEFR